MLLLFSICTLAYGDFALWPAGRLSAQHGPGRGVGARPSARPGPTQLSRTLGMQTLPPLPWVSAPESGGALPWGKVWKAVWGLWSLILMGVGAEEGWVSGGRGAVPCGARGASITWGSDSHNQGTPMFSSRQAQGLRMGFGQSRNAGTSQGGWWAAAVTVAIACSTFTTRGVLCVTCP